MIWPDQLVRETKGHNLKKRGIKTRNNQYQNNSYDFYDLARLAACKRDEGSQSDEEKKNQH